MTAIIPVLDEESTLADCLAALGCQEGLSEIVLVDGGSADGTERIAREAAARLERAGIALRVIRSTKGRASQMNAGAAMAAGDVLVFVHADTRLPAGGVLSIARAIGEGYVGGAFRHRFVERDARLAVVSWYANARSRLAGIFFGDQAIFVRKDLFERMGGFRPIPIMEDLEFTSRMRVAGRTLLLQTAVVTSARRFLADGIARTCLRLMLLRTAYRAGVDPSALAGRYREIR